MKKTFYVFALVLLVISSLAWYASTKNFFRKEVAVPIKIGILFKGANFKQVADGFMKGFSENLPKDRKVEYVVIDEHGADQKDFDASAQHLVDSNVDLILAVGYEPLVAAKKATTENHIPIILELGVNPVTQGFVASFQKPGGNITGVSWQVEELTGKRFEYLKLVDPRIKRITIFRRKGTKIMDVPLQYLQPIIEKTGVVVTVKEFSEISDFQQAVLATTAANTDAIFYASDPFVQRNGAFVIKHALEEKIPVMFHDDYLVRAGATASYGANFIAAGNQGARIAAKILLEKQSPADIPVEVVSSIDFAVNLASAKTIGLAISDDVISLAQIVVKE